MDETKYNGIAPDLRTEDEKLDDIKFEEVVASAAPVNWIELDPSTWPVYSIRNQDGSGSCVAQTIAKMAEIILFLKKGVKKVFSASDIYEDRVNKPGEGMIAYDVFNLAARGIATEANMPSQNMNEDQMNNAPRSQAALNDRDIIKMGPRVDLPSKDIDAVASVIQVTGKPVMVWFFATGDEWNKDVPTVNNPDLKIENATIVHSLTGVIPTLWKGEPAIIIDDSWGRFGTFVGRRVITKSFYEKRNFYAGYPMNFKFKGDVSFDTDLTFGMRINADVKLWQKFLQGQGFFPLNIDCTGNFLSITAQATLAFQKHYKVASDSELNFLKGRLVGPATRGKANELLANK